MKDIRNLSDKCFTCPYREKWGLEQCINEALPHLTEKGIYGEGCKVPWQILMKVEEKRGDIYE